MLYDNILDKCKLEFSRVNVKVTMYIFREKKHVYHSSSYICESVSVLLHTNVNYDNILDKCVMYKSMYVIDIIIHMCLRHSNTL